MSLRERIFGRDIRKDTSIVPELIYPEAATARIPKWDLPGLYRKAEDSWQLQQIFRVIIQEVKRTKWDLKPKFKKKCKACGTESPSDVDSCPVCDGRRLRVPDKRQYPRALKIIKAPNDQRQRFADVLTSIIYHELVSDNFFISVAYAPKKTLDGMIYVPAEIYVEDPRNFRIISDNRGRLGGNEWFCPICYPEKTKDIKDKPGQCRICGASLEQAAYEQDINGEKTKFSKTQVVHGSQNRILPYIYGAPRLASAWNLVHVLEMMDQWFYDTYQEGRLAKIINFPGYTPDQVKALAVKLKEGQKSLDQIDVVSGDPRPKRSARNLMLASQLPIGVYDVMPSPDDMRTLEYYQLGITALCGIYGVQPIFLTMMNQPGARGGNTPYIQIDVNNRTIEEAQNNIEDIINEQLFPIFGITDWVLSFGDLEKKDALRDAQILQIRADTASTLINAGFDIRVIDGERIEIPEKSDPEMRMSSRVVGPSKQKPKESESSGQVIEGTTTERLKKLQLQNEEYKQKLLKEMVEESD